MPQTCGLPKILQIFKGRISLRGNSYAKPPVVPPFHPGGTVFFDVTAGKLFGQQRGEREPQRSVADPPLERNPQRRRWRRRRSANVWKRKHRKKRKYTIQ